jgi:hypothetical protein
METGNQLTESQLQQIEKVVIEKYPLPERPCRCERATINRLRKREREKLIKEKREMERSWSNDDLAA